MCCNSGNPYGRQAMRVQHGCGCGCIGYEVPRQHAMFREHQLKSMTRRIEDLMDEAIALKAEIAEVKKEG